MVTVYASTFVATSLAPLVTHFIVAEPAATASVVRVVSGVRQR